MSRIIKTAIMGFVLFGGCGVAAAQTSTSDAYSYGVIPIGAVGWKPSSIKRDGGNVVVETVFYDNKATGNYSWQFQKVKLVCLNKTYETIEGNYLNNAGVEVGKVFPGMVRPIGNSPQSIIHTAVCTSTTFNDLKTAPNRSALMKAVLGK